MSAGRQTSKAISQLLILAALSGCAERWEGFAYPNAADLTHHVTVGVYESLEACRHAARRTLASMNALEKGDWECGLNCDGHYGTVKICERTER